MTPKPTLVIFVGGLGGSEAEQLVSRCHQAVALDMLEQALATDAFAGLVLVTDIEELRQSAGAGVIVEPSGSAFHFGRKLRDVIRKYRIERPFYLSRGSLPLLGASQMGDIARKVGQATGVVLTNNVYSADLVAFAPGSAVEKIEPPQTDNPLPRLLRDQAGLPVETLERCVATLFDIDTPTDVLLLALHPGAGRHTRWFLETAALDITRLRQAARLLTDVNAEVVVAGRVGSFVWQRLEQDTACRVRMLAEERGMQADGREDRGEARSILGFYLLEVGIPRFFETLGCLGQAAFIDSRVIFAHLGLAPSRADRFRADLGDWTHIEDPFVREFTQCAQASPIPVVLGGHSLMAGGLLALAEASKSLGTSGR
ncbi:MAG: hypothetical protein Q7T04_08355 [Dehalococcoidia bacterium]|nr:hypothetical protein [Dehalococcoidia bacterium]